MKNTIIEHKLIFFESWVIFMGLFLLLFLIFFLDNNIFSFFMFIFMIISLKGFFLLNQNEAVVGIFFGKYIGSIKQPGFFWINPFIKKIKLSTKTNCNVFENIHVFNKKLPLILDVYISWNIQDTAKYLFLTDNKINFLNNFIKTFISQKINNYSIDLDENIVQLNKLFFDECNKELSFFGFEIIDLKLLNITYSEEIRQLIFIDNIQKENLDKKINQIEKIINIFQDVLNEISLIDNVENEDNVKIVYELLSALIKQININD